MTLKFQRGKPGRDQTWAIGTQATNPDDTALLAIAFLYHVQAQRRLATGHRQIDVAENLGIQQGAVQHTMPVVDIVALAQRIQVVALSGVLLSGQLQGIENGAVIGDRAQRVGTPGVDQPEFVIDEAHIEGRIVDDQLGTLDEVPEGIGNLGEDRLVGDSLIGDAVDPDRLCIDQALRIDVLMVGASGQAAVDHLHRADLDQAMAFLRVDTCRFGIENNLTHLRPLGKQ